MKRYLHAFAMCQSMFCALPCPWKIWDEQARPLMMLFLPVVGLEIGVIWAGLAWLVKLLTLPQLLSALILCAHPFVITGFLHLDGFMDVTDAVKSCRSLAKRREILKDSHVGAFAVIGCCLLMLSQFAMFASADGDWHILIFVPVVSRCCSALAVMVLKPMSTSQYAGQERKKAHGWILAFLMLMAIFSGFALCGKYGFALLGGLVGYGFALLRGCRSLGGMNGDISGCALTVSELCAITIYALI